MIKHTKGPWTIELTGDNTSNDRLIIGHPNINDLTVIRNIGRLWAYGTEEENKANARLIAAAPYQNTALKQIAKICQGCKNRGVGYDAKIHRIAKQAITKTKGESQ